MDSPKALIIESDLKLAKYIDYELRLKGYKTKVTNNSRTGLNLVEVHRFDVVILASIIGNINGFELARRLRTKTSAGILMLVDRNFRGNNEDKSNCADEYILKPFSIEELLSRISSVIRRADYKDYKETIYRSGDLFLDSVKKEAYVHGKKLVLTKKEYSLLLYLIKNKNIILTREQILEEVWGYSFVGETNIVDVYIRYLRKKLNDGKTNKYIFTHRGLGYCLKD